MNPDQLRQVAERQLSSDELTIYMLRSEPAPMSAADIATKLHMTRQGVDKIYKRAQRKIKEQTK